MTGPRNIVLFGVLFLRACSGRPLHHYEATQWDVISPDHNPCATSRGFYGRVAKFEYQVEFTYELTMVPGDYLDEAFDARSAGGPSMRPEGLDGLFNSIETGIADALLDSQVFETACAGGEVRGPFRRGDERQLLRENKRQLRAVGISSNPTDEILEGLTCRAFVNETDGPCMVVDGEFMIYLDIYEDLDSTLSEFLSNLMNVEHHLDDVHPYIQKVRYVELSADLISGSIEDETVGGQPGGNSATLSSSFYALLAAGCLIVVGTGVVYRRRRNAAEHDGETTTLDQRTAQ